jgi:CRP-like cAMP-binding protein
MERRPLILTPYQQRIYEISFSSISSRTFLRLFNLGEIINPNIDKLFIQRGRHLDLLYLIVDGEFEVSLETNEIKIIGSGGFLGELSFITGGDATANVSPLSQELGFCPGTNQN